MMIVFFGIAVLQFLQLTPVASQAKPGCQDKCGDVSIPYPFGIGTDCSRDRHFNVSCENTEHGQRPYIVIGNFSITGISLPTGEVRVSQHLALDCYNNSKFSPYFDLDIEGPYTFSDTENKFIALGCDTYATILQSTKARYEGFTTGCVSICNSSRMVSNDSCNGVGCCQSSIPKKVKYIEINITNIYDYVEVRNFSPCSFALLADRNWFTFHGLPDLTTDFYSKSDQIAPMVLDWTISNHTCDKAEKANDYACVSPNSFCYNSNNGPGYRCKCSEGYQGNPYLNDVGGCQDIDECIASPCTYGICTNIEGDYLCNCSKGKHSDDPRYYKCKSLFPVMQVALGTGIPFILILISSWIYLGLQTRKLNNLKEKFFQQNGGLYLQQLISSKPNITFKMFSKEDLEKATDEFNQNNILGQGGQGMVFKGVLPDNQVVAVKKSMVVNELQNMQFANEMIILSQINHRNVVKLLGCCVEVEVPMLVYEYISNGTLFQLIHGGGQICFKDRLRIATETASSIAYLHSAASPPILHGDIKSSNILLDENHMAKVSDFGASKLTPIDKDQFITFMQGTWGYLDPECLQTGQLTDKSDVYSFGVVLAELLTRRKAVSPKVDEKERNLANIFVSSMKESQIVDILDHEIVNEGRMDLILEICNLAKRCLNIKGEERPTMMEIAVELQRLTMFENHPWLSNNPEETESLLGQS